jgi:hypothetical protein
MILRVSIPTVQYVTMRDARPQPFVQVAYDRDAWQLDSEEASRAAGWMRVAHQLTGDARAETVARALDAAVTELALKAPRVLEDLMLGMVQGEASTGEPSWIEIGLEAAVNEPSNPRVMIDVAESLDALGASDTWWLLNDEAARLASLARQAAERAEPGTVGRLEEKGPNRRAWLFVDVASQPSLKPDEPPRLGVQLRFDDDLLSERGDDGVLWMSPADALRLAKYLDEALNAAAANPAYIYAPPEPGTREVANIPLAR